MQSCRVWPKEQEQKGRNLIQFIWATGTLPCQEGSSESHKRLSKTPELARWHVSPKLCCQWIEGSAELSREFSSAALANAT